MNIDHENRLGPLHSLVLFGITINISYAISRVVERFIELQTFETQTATSVMSLLVLVSALSYIFLADATRDLIRPLADNLDITADKLELIGLWSAVGAGTLATITTLGSQYIDGGTAATGIIILWAIAALETYRFESVRERFGLTEEDWQERFDLEVDG